MITKTASTQKKSTVLFIYRRDQKWNEEFQKLDLLKHISVKFIDEDDFSFSYFDSNTPDIIVLPLTLKEGLSLNIARQIQLQRSQTKLMLCSDTDVKEETIDYVFDFHLKRKGTRILDVQRALEKMASLEVKRNKNEKMLDLYIDSIIVNESWFMDREHNKINFRDMAFMKDKVKTVLRYYLLFLLITMVSTLYPVVDGLYKQMDGISPKDYTIFWLFIIPFLLPIIYTYFHHNIGEHIRRREKLFYYLAIIIECLLIIFFSFKHQIMQIVVHIINLIHN